MDTNGAGDAFVGGFLSQILVGKVRALRSPGVCAALTRAWWLCVPGVFMKITHPNRACVRRVLMRPPGQAITPPT